jgi:hypothetical protein
MRGFFWFCLAVLVVAAFCVPANAMIVRACTPAVCAPAACAPVQACAPVKAPQACTPAACLPVTKVVVRQVWFPRLRNACATKKACAFCQQ